MINSPIKRLIAQHAGKLRPLPNKQRDILAGGSESVVLVDGHNTVLLVTRKIAAKKIELLHGLVLDGLPFVKPTIVAMDMDLTRLINPDNPALARRSIRDNGAVFYPELWKKNVVYRLPRYDGTLLDLAELRFKEKNIEALETMLMQALTFLHRQQLSHNDIALKNIFYTGECPYLQFYLGDFGSLSKNTEKNHPSKCANDFKRMRRVIDEVKKIWVRKQKKREEIVQKSQALLPCFSAQLMKKIGVSPLNVKQLVGTSIPAENSQLKKARRRLRF